MKVPSRVAKRCFHVLARRRRTEVLIGEGMAPKIVVNHARFEFASSNRQPSSNPPGAARVLVCLGIESVQGFVGQGLIQAEMLSKKFLAATWLIGLPLPQLRPLF